ncbi:hypothetical protein ICG_02462 [Bacillus cereus BAG1X1-3]|nr:hypothetical protein ICG_05513 [Bacillus cereus BAG1X1-3]EJS56264.1 hypothetical protein ICG_02462 [Bacillus cereus BAG1X1-3]EOO75336.1 hypothetical protein IC7_05413 [Bacillus cereus BAG1O-1]EOO76637.1 hypothetical protein IC7_02435 [Bacillus cereus BAG1O-1]
MEFYVEIRLLQDKRLIANTLEEKKRSIRLML